MYNQQKSTCFLSAIYITPIPFCKKQPFNVSGHNQILSKQQDQKGRLKVSLNLKVMIQMMNPEPEAGMASAPGVLQGEAKAEPSPTKGEATSPTKVEKKEEDEAAKRWAKQRFFFGFTPLNFNILWWIKK